MAIPQKMVRIIYNFFVHTFGVPILVGYYLPKIIFSGKYRKSLGGKVGRLPDGFPKIAMQKPIVWFHAVSVGETVALAPVTRQFRKLAPNCTMIVSTGTETGQQNAQAIMTGIDYFIFMPIDLPIFVNRVTDRIKPDLFVLMETEIWPNLLYSLRKKGSKIVLANGRISDRSFPRYMKIQPFVAKILELIDMFLMASETDKDRICRMGAPVNRISVVGNTKFDAALRSVSKDVEKQARSILNLKETDKVWIAGSTHPGEHEIVLDCFQRLVKIYPELVLIIAPRHTETISSILSAINERGLETPFMRSSFDSGQRRQSQNIVVLDTTGELLKFYSVASVVFVGGSLVPKGGQNILEPVAWGKKVLFGPSMEDFRDARDLLLKVGAAVETSNGEELFNLVAESLDDMKHSAAMGRLGLEELAGHSGSAKTVARMLFNIISPEGKA